MRLVRSRQYTDADEVRLRSEFASRLGQDAHLEFEYVESIPKTASGKVRFVVSTLEEGRLAGTTG